jgi:hypothetical protein
VRTGSVTHLSFRARSRRSLIDMIGRAGRHLTAADSPPSTVEDHTGVHKACVRLGILRFVRWSQHSLIGVLLMVFTERMVPEVIQPFWAALQRGFSRSSPMCSSTGSTPRARASRATWKRSAFPPPDFELRDKLRLPATRLRVVEQHRSGRWRRSRELRAHGERPARRRDRNLQPRQHQRVLQHPALEHNEDHRSDQHFADAARRVRTGRRGSDPYA